jgi:hypothetical protein
LQRFKTLFGIASLNEDKLKQEIKKLSTKNADDAILLTICALYILQEYFEAREDEWQLIAKKAKTALKNFGILKLESYFQIISQTI